MHGINALEHYRCIRNPDCALGHPDRVISEAFLMSHWRTPHGQFRKLGKDDWRLTEQGTWAREQGYLRTPAEIMEMQRQASYRPVWWRRWLGMIQR